MKSKIIVLAVLLLCFFQINVNAQMDSTIHAFGVGYADLYTAKARGGESANGAGMYLTYQYSRKPHWGYGFQFSFTKAMEEGKLDDTTSYENTYRNFGYLFTTKYFFLPKKFKLFIGFNIGGTFINFTSDSYYKGTQLYPDTKTNGMSIGTPVGFYWFPTKQLFVNASYTPSIFLGSSLYLSDLLNTFQVGIGYYLVHHSKD